MQRPLKWDHSNCAILYQTADVHDYLDTLLPSVSDITIKSVQHYNTEQNYRAYRPTEALQAYWSV